MILVTTAPDAPLLVLEGHVRLTMYMLVPDYMPTVLEVIVGFSAKMADWNLY